MISLKKFLGKKNDSTFIKENMIFTENMLHWDFR